MLTILQPLHFLKLPRWILYLLSWLMVPIFLTPSHLFSHTNLSRTIASSSQAKSILKNISWWWCSGVIILGHAQKFAVPLYKMHPSYLYTQSKETVPLNNIIPLVVSTRERKNTYAIVYIFSKGPNSISASKCRLTSSVVLIITHAKKIVILIICIHAQKRQYL